MLGRVVRLLLRLAGWLLTPLVVTIASGIGAAIGLMVAPRFSPYGGLGVTAAFGLAGAIGGLMLWVRLLRRSPELREVLAVTPAGVPTHEAVDELIHPAHHLHDGDRPQ